MYTIFRQNRFKKDVELAKKRGKNLQKLKNIITALSLGYELDKKYKDHVLIGDYANTKECHIEPDWLLVYRIDKKEKLLYLIRTGTHSDLF